MAVQPAENVEDPAAVVGMLRWIRDEVQAGRVPLRWPMASGRPVLVRELVRTALRAGNEATVALEQLVGTVDCGSGEEGRASEPQAKEADLARRLAECMGFSLGDETTGRLAEGDAVQDGVLPASEASGAGGENDHEAGDEEAGEAGYRPAVPQPAGWLPPQPRRESKLHYFGWFALVIVFVWASGRMMA